MPEPAVAVALAVVLVEVLLFLVVVEVLLFLVVEAALAASFLAGEHSEYVGVISTQEAPETQVVSPEKPFLLVRCQSFVLQYLMRGA